MNSSETSRQSAPDLPQCGNEPENTLFREERRVLQRRIADMETTTAALEQQVQASENARIRADEALQAVLQSRSWKLTGPLRRCMALLRRAAPPPCPREVPSPGPAALPLVVLFSGMGGDDTPGHIYRIERLAAALRLRYRVEIHRTSTLVLPRLEQAVALWIWRAPMSPEVEQLIHLFKAAGKPVIFDIDDMCFHPAHFQPRYMDVIRSDGMDEAGLQACGTAMQMTMRLADTCVFTTEPLAHIASTMSGKPCMVIPNSFDRVFHLRAQQARLQALADKHDDCIRIGYAAGTATHQADVQLAVPALRTILSRHPEARLVLFRTMVDIRELDGLTPVSNQIEWRDPVPLQELPDELARFDINIAPLDMQNPFCNCKSELKFFEAALAEVPSVLSATEPMRAAVRHGETGYLAENAADWEEYLERLVTDRALRQRMGRAAYRSVLWTFGPENRSRQSLALVDSLFMPPDAKAASFVAHGVMHSQLPLPVDLPAYETVFTTGPAHSKVSVVIPLYNYETYIEEALDSLVPQTLRGFDVIVVDDASTDGSRNTARQWLEANQAHFASVTLLCNSANAGLALTRNAGIDYSRSEYVMLLDADNMLLPRCLELCAHELDASTAAAAYPLTETFGAESRIGPVELWNPLIFRYGNYVDAMAMIRKSHWAALGGYTRHAIMGWEDYDLWCKMIHYGFWGARLYEVTARYRLHQTSMLQATTNGEQPLSTLSAAMNKRYPWLNVHYPVQHGFPPF